MKKILTLTLIIIALRMVIIPVTYAEVPTVIIKSHQITEDVSPGEDFQIELNLLNTGTKTAENINVQVKASPPLTTLGMGEKTLNNLSQNEEITMKFSLKAEDTALEGTYPVEFLISYEDNSSKQYTKNYVANVAVEGEKDLILVVSESSKTEIYSGDTVTLTFKVLNNGSASIRSLVAKVSTEGALKTSWDSREHLIGEISPQGSTSFQLNLETIKQAPTNNYTLTIQLSGYNYSLRKNFQIPVKALPDIQLESQEAEELYPGKTNGLLTLNLANQGNKEGREIEGRLLPKYPFSTEETTQYIQDISLNNPEEMKFWLDVDEDAKPGEYSLTLDLEYKAWEQEFSQTLKIPLKIQEEKGIQIEVWWLIPIAVAIIAIAFAFKRLT